MTGSFTTELRACANCLRMDKRLVRKEGAEQPLVGRPRRCCRDTCQPGSI
jgi:hypothetical protein